MADEELTTVEKMMQSGDVLVNESTVYGCYVSGGVDAWFASESDAHAYCQVDSNGVEFNDQYIRPVYIACCPGELAVDNSEAVYFSYERRKFVDAVAHMSEIPTEWVIPTLGKPAVSAA